MTFMQKQIDQFKAWQVETTCGTETIPADLVGEEAGKDCRGLEDYLEGKQLERAELVHGWFSRLSAPGYMDCTEWSGPYDTEQEATTDYMADSAHCPSYDQRQTLHVAELVKQECETGRSAKGFARRIEPQLIDVLYSLAPDADVLNYGGFENWAENFGYDKDSRKAEATYRACLDIALKLRNGIGDDGLAKLQTASQDY